MTTKENLQQPAFPAFPAMDNLNRIVAPFPGMSKLEHCAFELLKISYAECLKQSNEDDFEISSTDIKNMLDICFSLSEVFFKEVEKRNEQPKMNIV